MVLAFVKIMIEAKLNPVHRFWVHAQDVDRTTLYRLTKSF